MGAHILFRYTIRRVLEMLPILLIVTILVFLFIHLIPGDPARLMAGKLATEKDIISIREELGLNKPLLEQYFSYMINLFQGDLGMSLVSGRPVTDMIAARFIPTFVLTFVSLAWAIIAGLILGIISATKRNKWQDYIGQIVAVSGISIPAFWFGLILIQLFSVKLGWLPSGSMESWKSYILPAFTLSIFPTAVIARFTRSSLMDTLKMDYIRTGRAKGLKESTVIRGHALRNALIPVVTVIGLQFGFLLGGSVVIETVFSWPGLGRLLIDSITFRDYPVIQAELLLFAFQFILINLLVDILYGILNPQIRYD